MTDDCSSSACQSEGLTKPRELEGSVAQFVQVIGETLEVQPNFSARSKPIVLCE